MPDEDPGPEIEVRASDAEREATVARLRDAAAEGRLSLDELAERVEAADGALTRADLASLVADLPAERTAAAPSVPAPQTRRLYGILGGDTLSGRVRLGSEARVINVMGGADLDLTDAVLTEGGHDPRLLTLGRLEHPRPRRGARRASRRRNPGLGQGRALSGGPGAAAGAPVVRVRSISIMGGTDIRRGPPRPWRWPWKRRERALPPTR